MRVLVLSERAVRSMLSMRDCIDAMERAFLAAARGDFVQPLRIIAWQRDRRGAIAAMPAQLDGALGAKLITVFPQNRAEGLESHQGLIALYEGGNGRMLAVAHAGAVTAVRTAAVSALATKLLANADAGDLALLGSGVQAEEHLRAIAAVRTLRKVRVWSRTHNNAREFAERNTSEALPITAYEHAADAVRDADLICTVTAATDPVLHGEWIAAGAHINAVGSSVPPFRELDTAAVTRSRIYVDMRETVLQESDDLRAPIRDGEISERDIVGELAELVAGTCPRRATRDDITLFKSVGMAIEDVAAVQFLYERALETGSGEYVEF